MSSFIEFQAMVLGKLCSIEERISNIETVLGIDMSECTDENIDSSPENIGEISRENSFVDDISDFHRQLDDIKSIFDRSDI